VNRLRGVGALSWAYVLDSWRSKPAVFWNFAFPILVLIGFSYILGNGQPTMVAQMVPGILTINLLAATLFSISFYMVSLREKELYRRFRVTPVGTLTVVVAHSLIALANIAVACILQLAVAKILFHIVIRSSVDVVVALLLAAFAFIPIGLLVGSVAQDMRTAPAISNLLFFPLTFLSGAAMPLFLMPSWIQRLATLVPSTYAVELLQAAILRGSVKNEIAPGVILGITGVLAFAFNVLLFRWESSEVLRRKRLCAALLSLAITYVVAFAHGVRLLSAQAPAVSVAPASDDRK
jgi:ABC-2 type transport system permease protein